MSNKKMLRALGEEIRVQRVARKLSQEDLADRADLHRNMIGRLERGEANPSYTTMRAVCAAMRMKLSAFILALESNER